MFSNRVLHVTSGGVITDISDEMNDYLAGTKVLALGANDYLYLGSDLPFNHRWIEVSSPNALASVMSVQVWGGARTWVDVVELLDYTKVSGATLAQSGIVAWVPDKDYAWLYEQTTEDIPALSTLTMYELYWCRIKFSAAVTGTTALKFIGHKFAGDTELAAEYPDLNRSAMMTAFAAGKTSWNEQHYAAAEYVINDLKQQSVLKSQNQLLDWKVYKSAAVHRCAMIIYGAFGDRYSESLKNASLAYKKAIDVKYPRLDMNKDGREEPAERRRTTGWMTR